MTDRTCLYRCVFACLLAVVIAGRTVRAWDLGVVTRSQIQFLARHKQNDTTAANGTTPQKPDKYVLEHTAADQLKEMVAAAYDPVGKYVYVSDSNANAGSIFRIRTIGDAAYTVVEPVVAKQMMTVAGMAFDERTSTLYWTTGIGQTINYLHVPEIGTKNNLLTGHVLMTFKHETPQDIAIDSCRGYLYWTNMNHLNATVERSRLDGTDRRVIVHENLFQPLGVAVDVEHNRVYWSDEREGMYYSIESSDLDGNFRQTVVHGTHHQPFSIALDDRYVYWSDWVSNAVRSWPKDGSAPVDGRAAVVAQYESILSPMALIMRSGNTSLANQTVCAMDRAKDLEAQATEPPPAVMLSYEALRNICKNGGILHATNGTCVCAPGYTGSNCETDVCDGYCVAGMCTVDGKTGRPQCRCPDSEANLGDRCEPLDLPVVRDQRCECPACYADGTCKFQSTLLTEQLCDVYCQNVAPNSQHWAFCRCEEGFDHRRVESIYSDMSSCKLSKTIVAVFCVLMLLVACLGTVTMVLVRKVRLLGRRPRIKKRIVVNKSITPLTSCRPPQQQQNQQCEITIENCCNMNICETPCFEPDFRPQKLDGIMPSKSKSKKEDKANLLSNTDMTSSEDEKPVY